MKNEKETFTPSNELINTLGIDPTSIIYAPFQGERSSIYTVHSSIYDDLVIKSSQKNGMLSEAGIEEIKQNIEGYQLIPERFRPQILAVDPERNFLVMKNAGKPLRDLLWLHKDDKDFCRNIIDNFLYNLADLFNSTQLEHQEDSIQAYISQLQTDTEEFVNADFFSDKLRIGLRSMLVKAAKLNDGVGAFAPLDSTQGNLLIDIKDEPHSLRIIDPKRPRTVNGKGSFIGIPEVDMGMFITTLTLNAPQVVEDLSIEERIKELLGTFRTNREVSDFFFELGKLYGNIVIAAFPNSPERVEQYLKSFNVEMDEKTMAQVMTERPNHIQSALEIIKENS